MKLVGQEFRSKATYMKGRIVKTSLNYLFINFNKNNEYLLRISFEDFLKYCLCSDEVKEEVLSRIEKQREVRPNEDISETEV